MLHERYGYGLTNVPPGHEPFQLIWMLLLLTLVVVLSILAVKYLLSHKTPSTTSTDTPLEVLNLRYAKGEIDRAEYETIKRSILEDSHDSAAKAKADSATDAKS